MVNATPLISHVCVIRYERVIWTFSYLRGGGHRGPLNTEIPFKKIANTEIMSLKFGNTVIQCPKTQVGR